MSTPLVQRPSAGICPTQTRDLLIFNGELVVIRELLIDADRLPGVYNYLLLRFHCDYLCIAIRLNRDRRDINLVPVMSTNWKQ